MAVVSGRNQAHNCHLTHKSATGAKICVKRAKWQRYASNSNQMFLLRSFASSAPFLCSPYPPFSHPAPPSFLSTSVHVSRPYRPAMGGCRETIQWSTTPCLFARCLLMPTFLQFPQPFYAPLG